MTAELRTAGSGADPIELGLGPFKQRLLLAMLLCRSNGVVLIEELIDTLWWEGPPRTAHKNIQVYISHLRKLLAADGRQDRLRYRPPGYQLLLSPPEVDALQFEDLSRAGRLALRRGDMVDAEAHMGQALRLWRGPALVDLLVSPAVRAEASRLDDRRLAVYEDWFEVELALGNHSEVLEEIEALVRMHPLRERLRSQQLTALHRGGRQAEALAEYDNLRQLLAAELGLGPSPALQRLYQNILSGHPALNPPPVSVRRREPHPEAEVVAHLSGLPRDVDDFTGRTDTLSKLLTFFGDGATSSPRQGRFAAITGPPGSGTTTLALHAAHMLAPQFPDGHVLLPLRDERGVARPPGELLDELLSRLGPVPPRTAGADRDRGAVLRSRLAGRQLLLVLDGAADAAQVRPLLPGSGGCSVILTSCRHLGGLEGFGQFALDVFTEAEALDLLRRTVGAERVSGAPAAALRIVRACGLLPLAVRIAGARLAGLGHLPLEQFADRLEDEGRLLDELVIGDLSVRDCYVRYLRVLGVAERLALIQLAATWSPASKDPSEMEDLLERLACVHALTITEDARECAVRPLPFVMPLPLWVFAQQLLIETVRDVRD
ncbi:BTAD domain-containing putative transcriptional regulator [Peterkaempfera sp. SMS 1(5)a]|uniref:AfsR/SARP family transcriptional regulator n=1 Tax=Peterkaempfera podocarpi TaxID=3232308 RepID=UPI00366FA74E